MNKDGSLPSQAEEHSDDFEQFSEYSEDDLII